MSRYTVNLSRARTYSRRKRAQKAMSILREQLEKREGKKVSISPEVNRKIWERGAEKPPASIEVEITETAGEPVAVLPGSEPEVEEEPEEAEEPTEEVEETESEETPEEDTEEESEEPEEAEEAEEEAVEEEPGEDDEPEVDYSEIVSGTISDAKEQLQELEDPDYGAALEAEKSNKDRKTLKEWLENRE